MKARIDKTSEGEFLWFFCPGCDTHHMVRIEGNGPRWSWNGVLGNLTINPSIRTFDDEGTICHSFVKNGQILFLTDSRHALAGHTVDLPDLH